VIDNAGYQSKNNRETSSLHVFFVLSTWPVSPSGIYGALLLNDNSEKERYSRGIAGITDQQTAFTRAQGAILQSRDFNLRVERTRKMPYPRS